MTRERDTFTSTVDGAAAHAALFSDDYPDDVVTLADVAGLDAPLRFPELCKVYRTNPDGSRSYCCRVQHVDDHGRTVGQHEPYPYTVPAEAFAPGGWMHPDSAPF